MDNYVDQSHCFGQQPVIVNNLNVPKPPPEGGAAQFR